MNDLGYALHYLDKLSPSDLQYIVKYLYDKTNSHKGSVEDFIAEHRFNGGRYCVHCGSQHVVRNGHLPNGTQRFRCKDCHKAFVPTTNTVLYKTKKPLTRYEKFVSCMVDGMSVRKTAWECGIHRNTAFRWRHKFLDALQQMAEGVILSGIVEADEKFFAVSFKGNHKMDGFEMPREAYKRGSECKKRGLSREKVCVPCAVNRDGLSIAKVSSLGKASVATISSVLEGRIAEHSVICTDKEKSYIQFSEENNLTHVRLKTGKKVVKGIYHIQHVNSYHGKMEAFINIHLRGVSTKYLNNYLIWHNFIHYARENAYEKREILLRFVLTAHATSYGCNISDRPVLPLLVA